MPRAVGRLLNLGQMCNKDKEGDVAVSLPFLFLSSKKEFTCRKQFVKIDNMNFIDELEIEVDKKIFNF